MDLLATKILWEAKDEQPWCTEFDLREQDQNIFTLVRPSQARFKYGDLVRLNKQRCGYQCPDIQKDESRLADRIAKWRKEMDGFGMLVASCNAMV